MKITLKKCLAALGMVGLCVGLIGCGKSEGPVAESTVPLERGEHIMYGSYQGEDIEWRVLDKKGDKVLLLSEYGLDIQPFDTSDVSRVLWKDSTMRKWLNNDFYDNAFSENEKKNIVLSYSKGFKKNNESVYVDLPEPYWHLERETEDKIFLLSYTELCEYLVKNTEVGYYDPNRAYNELLCYPTEYAKKYLKQVFEIDTCGWWLCNPEYDTGDGAAMQIEMISAYGQLEVEDKENGKNNAVRPAMWVTWQSDMQVIEE